MADSRPSITRLVATGILDAELASLLWLLGEHGVPIVVASRAPASATEIRSALGALMGDTAGLSDSALAGGTISGDSLEDVLRLSGTPTANDEIVDEARDIGVVLVMDTDAARPEIAPVIRAHYVRPVERDVAGHLQRRPPALLSAADDSGRLDHFFWAISDELATRVDMDAADFEREHARRAVLLRDLAAAHAFDAADLRRHIDAAGLIAATEADSRDAPN